MVRKEENKKSSLEERIIENLENSGYPLEIHVTSLLESKGWGVVNQDGYRDVEEDKWRTIDISAFKRIDIPNSPVYQALHFTLTVECKKSEKPWVFWVRDKENQRLFIPLLAYSMIKLESNPPLHPLYLEKIASYFHYYFPQFKKVAFIFFEAFKSGEKDEIFEAKNQVIKALMFKRKQIGEKLLRLGAPFNQLILVFYPLIIFDGPLYELEIMNEKPKLTPAQYIQYFTYYGLYEPEMFIIDIVKKDYIHEYLEILEKEIKQLTQTISSLKSPMRPPS